MDAASTDPLNAIPEPAPDPAPLELESIHQARFLAAYEKLGTVLHAAKLASVHRSCHYRWLKEDKTYPARFQEAHQAVCDAIELEIFERAQRGWEEPVYYQGVQCGTILKKSDTLLIFRAKALMPDKYGERAKLEHSGAMGLHHSGLADMAQVRQLVLGRPDILAQHRDEVRATTEPAEADPAQLPGSDPDTAPEASDEAIAT